MLHYNITLLNNPCFPAMLQIRPSKSALPARPARPLILSLFSCLLLFLASSGVRAGDSGDIVVTIKPLYSLVAQLTRGISQPALLMKQAQSPHHYNMRPSQRRLLAKAKVIIWIGPAMEGFASKIIEQQQSALVISALQAKDLQLLYKRGSQSAHDQNHDIHESPDKDKIDPHIWLSTHNAIAISRHIYQQLVSFDRAHAAQYKKNLQTLLSRIRQTDTLVRAELKNTALPFISFHDAFQYFEKEYRLNYAGSVNLSEEAGASLKHLRQISARIDKDNIQCLVYQPPRPALVDSLLRQRPVRAVALDPLGLNTQNAKNAWFELMQQLALGFGRCLNP